jgi:2-polyprenyl-3-methyl-5-hydroxy-6-metoxy-1,4-benzoquinol methylase
MLNQAIYYQANRNELAGLLPEKYKKVLEIGCGEGNFINCLKQPDEVWGIEPNQYAAQIASKKMTKVMVGKYQDFLSDLPDDYFDLVICNDVIEHMEDHDWFFDSIKKKMSKNSHLIGSVPNIRHITSLYKLLINKDWLYKDAGILDKTHLRFFTEKSLKRTFAEHGFIVRQFQGINSVIVKGINRAVNKASFKETLSVKLITLFVIIGTLGYYWDTQFPQYSFRLNLNNE